LDAIATESADAGVDGFAFRRQVHECIEESRRGKDQK
jgi:hypothetical protein